MVNYWRLSPSVIPAWWTIHTYIYKTHSTKPHKYRGKWLDKENPNHFNLQKIIITKNPHKKQLIQIKLTWEKIKIKKKNLKLHLNIHIVFSFTNFFFCFIYLFFIRSYDTRELSLDYLLKTCNLVQCLFRSFTYQRYSQRWNYVTLWFAIGKKKEKLTNRLLHKTSGTLPTQIQTLISLYLSSFQVNYFTAFPRFFLTREPEF